MNSLPSHPLFVHVPLALAILLPLVAAGLLVAWWRGRLPGRAWWLFVSLQAALVVGGFVAMQTGEADEERVEAVVAEAAIEAHEEAAEGFVWTAAAVLVLAAAALALPGERLRRGAALAAVLGTLVVLGLGLRVGHAGGELVYRHGAGAVWSGAAVVVPTDGAPASDERDRDRDRSRDRDRDRSRNHDDD